MAMWTVIIKNNSGSDKILKTFGITLADSTQVTLSDRYAYDRIAGDDDLRAAIAAEDLVLNDGTEDLSAAAGVKYLTFIHEKYLEDNYYTKSQITNVDGILYAEDTSRSNKKLSAPMVIKFSKKGMTKDQFLESGSDVSSMLASDRFIRNVTITGLSCDLSASGTAVAAIRKKGSDSDLDTLTVTSAVGGQKSTSNVDASAGEVLQVRLTSAAGVLDPVVTVEYRYRA